MPRLLFILFCLSAWSAALSAQSQIQQRTTAVNSPSIFASSVSIAYGIRPSIVLELDSLFAKQELSPARRREEAVRLVARFGAMEGDPKTGAISEADVRQALGEGA